MYYPLLRARQFELIALRELANEDKLQPYITPILEPVKETLNNLKLAYKIFIERKQTTYLIVNPKVGDATGDKIYFLNFLSEYNEETLLAAFYYCDNADYIINCIDSFNLKNCMLICSNDVSATNKDFQKIVNQEEITKVNMENPERNRELKRYVSGLKKTYIRLDDFFEKQARNSDFLQITEHKFSEEHLYYDEEGFNGFADYTILPSEFTDGGSTPRAVVIHLTFLDDNNQIWIKHFTSETNDSIANVQGKFSEAAEKAVTYCHEHKLTNSAIDELKYYYDDQHYPGLGMVKKISIKNHLLVIQSYLNKK